MYFDDEFEAQLDEMRQDHYARMMERCCNCGSEDVCATAGTDAYCGPCWREREAEKKARRAANPGPRKENEGE